MSELPEELEARIAAYIDDELPPAEAARLEVFLANTDPQLAQQVIGMLADRHAARSLPRASAPADLSARIMEQVERTTLLHDVDAFATPHRPAWASRAAVAAALLLVLGGFTYFIYTFVHREAETPWHSVVSADARHSTPVAPSTPPAAPADAGATPASEPQALAAAPASEAAPLNPMAKHAPESAPLAFADNTPADQTVRVTLLAGDPADAARLRALLEDFLTHDPDTARRQADLPDASFTRKAAQDKPEEPFIINEPQRPHAALQQQYGELQQAPTQQTRSQIPTLPEGPYRILLRPAQLQELTHQFQVQTLVRRPAADTQAPTLQNSTAANSNTKDNSLQSKAPTDTTGDWLDCTITLTPLPNASLKWNTPPAEPATTAPTPASTMPR